MTMANHAGLVNEQSPLIQQPPHSEDGIDRHVDLSSDAEVSSGRLAIVLGSIWIGVVFTAIDATVVATLLLPMTTEFGSLKTLSWLGSSFLIAATAGIPLAGRLTDLFGRGPGAVLCNLIFTAGTLICGLATREWVLILGRVLSGLGAGPLRTISSFVSSDLVPTRRRGLVQGLNLVCMGAGTAIGGSFGGWMDRVLGWRWAFLVQVPFLLVGTVLVFLFVRIRRKSSETPMLRRVDWFGCLSLVTFLVLLLLGVSAGGNLVPWSHPLVAVTLPLALAVFAAFLWIEHSWAAEPILPLHLFVNRTVSASCATYLFAHMAAFGIIYFIPIFVQIHGKSAAQAGLQFIPQAVGNAGGAVLAGSWIRGTGRYFWLNTISQLCLLAASIAIFRLGASTPGWAPFLYLGIHGFGFGIMLVVAFIALLSAVPHSEQAVATSALIALGSAGSALGVAVCSAVFQNVLRTQLYSRLDDSAIARDIIKRVSESFGAVPDVDPTIRPQVRESFQMGVQAVFLLTMVMTVCALGSACFIQQNKLHNKLSRTDEDDSDCE